VRGSGEIDEEAEDAAGTGRFEAACGGTPPRSTFAEYTGTATITGVGFFDKKHGQRGVADNGIELHPLLAFKSTNCRRK
jgi:hypothetical protein